MQWLIERIICAMNRLILHLITCALVLSTGMVAKSAWATSEIDFERLATAIGKAENSTAHPYGIMQRYKYTTPRQACINTIKHKYRDWVAEGSRGDYLAYLQTKYAPLNAQNDPSGLNYNWLSNVRRLYR